MKKRALITFVVLLCFVLLTIAISAHSGKTDSNGGHYNNSTGEYHYHHGHSAHQHYDMDGDGIRDCPYDFNDKTNHNSSSSNTTSPTYNNTETNKTTPQKTDKHLTFGEILLIILKIIGSSLMFLLMGIVVWGLVYSGLTLLQFWICEKILKIDANSSIISIISIIIIIVVVIIISSIIVLNSEGLL